MPSLSRTVTTQTLVEFGVSCPATLSFSDRRKSLRHPLANSSSLLTRANHYIVRSFIRLDNSTQYQSVFETVSALAISTCVHDSVCLTLHIDRVHYPPANASVCRLHYIYLNSTTFYSALRLVLVLLLARRCSTVRLCVTTGSTGSSMTPTNSTTR